MNNHKNINSLRRECETLCRYLMGKAPNDYITDKYVYAHEIDAIPSRNCDNLMDGLLLKIARLCPFGTKLVDAYAVVLLKNSLVRKKLVLLLAILESYALSDHYLRNMRVNRKGILFFELLSHILSFALTLGLAVVLLAPIHIILTMAAKTRLSDRRLWNEY